ncbi:hypothetical protein GCM10028786_17240 [Flaviaesturariibacter terrae]
MKPLLIALGAIFLGLSASAQPTGYVIRLTGDTVHGTFPNYRLQQYSPAEIHFVSNGTEQKLRSSSIRGFAIDSAEVYRSFEGTRMTNPLQVVRESEAQSHAETKEPVSAFVRAFAHAGKITFYVYRDALRPNFYYADGEGELIELKQSLRIDPETSTVNESGIFRRQLWLLFGKDPGHLLYEETAIASWIEHQEGGDALYRRRKNPDDGFIVLLGLSHNDVQISSPDKTLEIPLNIQSSFTASAGYRFRLSPKLKRVFLFPQVSLLSFQAAGRFDTTNSSRLDSFQARSIMTVGLYAGFRVLSTSQIKVNLSGGGDLLFLFNNKYRSYYVRPNPPLGTEIRELENKSLLRFTQRVRVLGDVEWKRLIVWASFQPAAVFAHEYTFKGTFSTTQAGIGYRL